MSEWRLRAVKEYWTALDYPDLSDAFKEALDKMKQVFLDQNNRMEADFALLILAGIDPARLAVGYHQEHTGRSIVLDNKILRTYRLVFEADGKPIGEP